MRIGEPELASEAEAQKAPLFARFARWVERQVGRSVTFVLATAVVLLWAVSGPFFGWSDTWQLVNEMARNSLIDLEEMSDIDVERMKRAFSALASIETPGRRPAQQAASDRTITAKAAEIRQKADGDAAGLNQDLPARKRV